MVGTWGKVDSVDEIPVERLLNELNDRPDVEGPRGAGATGREALEHIRQEALGELFADRGDGFEFDEALVKETLDEVLVMLVALHDGGVHGKGLMESLANLFDAQLSPGTVYPRLHQLEQDGVLAVHEMVRTKEYTVSDDGAARRMATEAMYQHLALGFFLASALERTEPEPPNVAVSGAD